MSVDDLIEELIRNIRRRLPRYCVECEEWYRSEPNTEKVAECLICQVGIHGCKNVERRLKEGLRNSTWICKECNDTLHGEDERILKGVRKNVKTTTAKVSKTRPIKEGRRNSSLDEANRGDERERTSGTGTESERNRNVDTDTDGRENGRGNGGRQPTTGEGNGTSSREGRNDIHRGQGSRTTENIQARKVCSFYLRNKCFYGNGCRDEHPDLCEDTMLVGSCTDTTYCNRYHPEVCRKYRDTGICRYGDRCYYVHPINAPHARTSHEQGYGEYNNHQQGYRQYDWRRDQTQQDRDTREYYHMRARGWGDENGNNIRFNERSQYPHNDDPFLEGIWEFVRERMDRRERMHRRY